MLSFWSHCFKIIYVVDYEVKLQNTERQSLENLYALYNPVLHSKLAETVHSNWATQVVSKVEGTIIFITGVGFIEHIRDGRNWSIVVYIISPLSRKLWQKFQIYPVIPSCAIIEPNTAMPPNGALIVFRSHSFMGSGWNQWRTGVNSPQTWCIHRNIGSTEIILLFVLLTKLWPRSGWNRWFSTCIQ